MLGHFAIDAAFQSDWVRFGLACIFGFFAGLVDSISGGGGLISLPGLLVLGIPPHFALGTNKLAGTIGTVASSLTYLRHKLIEFRVVLVGGIFVLAGGFLGSRAVQMIDQRLVATVVVVLLPVGLFPMIFRRKSDSAVAANPSYRSILRRVPALTGAVGVYDGFFGPGAGAFLVIGLNRFLQLPLLQATATSRVLNLMSNAAALTAFLAAGKVLIPLGSAMAMANVVGGLTGAQLAIRRGDGLIRMMLISVVLITAIVLIGRYVL
ncbi:sulfite exporter TauE/SafE family protein [bacterium]|nr:sulfite exporter TauE/SafE family protein [bacterium]